MKKSIAFIILLSIIPIQAHAENSAKQEKIEKIFELMDAEKMIDSLYTQIDQLYAKMAEDLNVEKEDRPVFERYMQKLSALMREEMTWEKMKGPITEIYVTHYTEDEIDALLAFYSSEAGRSILKKMPAVLRDSMQISQNMLVRFMPRMRALVQEMSAELIAEREKREKAASEQFNQQAF